jgi:hypothetical protein
MNSARAFFTFMICLLSTTMSGQQKNVPVKVEIKQEKGAWQLYRGGEPYYIKGVGGQVHLNKAVEYGANSVRTWGVDEAVNILDEAHAKGLTVLFGLWVGCERQGFDYNDAKGVKAQLEGFTEVVKMYKDHPAILMWAIGNEADLFYSDFKVWNAINDIAKMIHETDPNHPTMTVTAGFDVAEVQLIKERAPHIDVYGVNTYAALIGIDKEMRSFGWDKPYVITEWGPSGHWEVAKTSWGVPIEQTSREKAASYKERYEKGIARDPEMCIGSYVFLWGQKQETTPTWYGVFLEDGTETEVTDVLQYLWSGKYPENRAPTIMSVKINNKAALESIYLEPGKYYEMEVKATDLNNDPLQYRWELLPESRDIKSGGDAESKPEPQTIKTKESGNPGTLYFRAPTKQGPYRMFVYVSDGKGKSAVANIPFYSKSEL